MTRYVAVVGPGDAAAEQIRVAEDVGRGLAGYGVVVLTGGLGGVMAAAARGAAAAGGLAVGLLPGTDRQGAAPELAVALPTGLGEVRNALLVRAADAVVAVGGSWGTCSEVALAMRTGTPVVAIGGWRFADAGGREIGVPSAADAAAAVAWVAARLGLPAASEAPRNSG